MTPRTKLAPSRYCAILASRPSSRRSNLSAAPAPLRRSVNLARISVTLGMTFGPTSSMTTSAWPSSRLMIAVTSAILARCSGVAKSSASPPPPLPRASGNRLRTCCIRSASSLGVGVSSPARVVARWIMCSRNHGTAVNWIRCVSSCIHTQARKSAASTSNSRSTCTRFGATSSRRGVPWGARSYCPRTLLAMNAISAPDSAPVIFAPTPMPGAVALILRSAATLAKTGVMSAAIESILSSIHRGRSTTRAGGAIPGASIREVSATGAWASAAACRMAATMSAASAALTAGPADTRRRPVALANSQSTKLLPSPASVGMGSWPLDSLGETASCGWSVMSAALSCLALIGTHTL